MKNKRVLFINSIVGTGSTGRIISGLCGTLKDKGADSLVCYGRGKDDENVDTYRIGSDVDVYAHGMISRITDRHGLYSGGVTRKLLKVIDEYDPDLIHLHNLHGYYLNYEILWEYLKKKDIPLIWTLHDCWSFTGHCTHFEYAGCSRWKEEGCHDCMQLREYPRSWLKDASESNYRLKKRLFTGRENLEIVTPSNWLKERVGESFLKEYNVQVIPTGIDLECFKPTESDIKSRYGLQGKTVILGVANPWRERKGLDEFIKLSGMLSDEYRIVMIGLKEKQLSMLPRKITAIKKTDSLEEMVQWYSAADIFLNLTREDTFPTTNIEALACGCPVVTYEAGGSPESVDETCGKTVEIDDINGIVDTIAGLGKKNSDMCASCRKKALQYDKNVRFLQYYDNCYAKYLS